MLRLLCCLLLGISAHAADAMVTVVDLVDGALTKPTAMAKVVRTDAEWKKLLSPQAYTVLRSSATEAPHCGGLLKNSGVGYYVCGGCDLPLFHSKTKFDSGTGWPSFWQEVYPGNVTRIDDEGHGMIRTEIRCARCDGHLGHVFDDGPKPTGERHCLNSAALRFVPAAVDAKP